MHVKRAVFAIVACALLAGCASGLKLLPIKSTSNKPSNVVVYFKVETSGGQPVGGLTADSFKIYEDGDPISQYESKQTILNPEVAASHYTLLLVDMSGSITDSGSVDTLVDAVGTFTDKVEQHQKVAIYAFDGSPDLHPLAPFSANGAKAGVAALASYKPKDPSTNLNGAIIKGLDELKKALDHADNPLRFGTLVVFTDGTDRARRVSEEQMKKAIADTPYDVFAIGLGAEMQDAQLAAIGKTGTAKAADKNAVVNAFDQVATRIEAATKAYYLLSYCSPARAGQHEVTVEAHFKDAKNDLSGSLEDKFDATGFGVGCDPNQKPSFDITKGDELAPGQAKGTVKAPKIQVKTHVKASGSASGSAGGSGSGGSSEPFTP